MNQAKFNFAREYVLQLCLIWQLNEQDYDLYIFEMCIKL